MSQTWKVILNKNAGFGRAGKDWPLIEQLLKKEGFSFDLVVSEYAGHAIKLGQEAVEQGFRKMIVIGGDGTLNEVVNGVFAQNQCATDQVAIGMIMVGTGNDWGKTFGLPEDYEQAIKLIKSGKDTLQDVGYISFEGKNKIEKRYFVNIAGLGFDARVVQKVNESKISGRGGALTYYKNLLMNLLGYRSAAFTMLLDEKTEVSDNMFSLEIGKGKYNGNGMQPLPQAVYNDGWLHVTLIRKLSKLNVILSLKRLYNGSLLSHKKARAYQAKKIQVHSNHDILIEADGESLGKTPCSFGIVPLSLKIFIPDSDFLEGH